ncbi:MAG: hypothetical protein HY280_03350 [Nitrospinae bacterium]|nr:hypothetical protein [Nitrospinota bacterium]
MTELQTLNRIGEKFDVALRINVDRAVPVEKGGRVMTGGMDKFGFTADDASKILLGRGKYKNLNFVGFHFYLGTQMLSPKTWLKGAESYARCVAKICQEAGFTARYLNFGGGLGIPYRTGERELSLDALEKGVKKLERFISGVDELSGAKLYMEPGRYLIGSAGVYVTRVVAVKNIRGTDFALTDGGIHHALFPFRVSREFPAFRVDGKAGRPRRYVLGGPLCTTLDQSDLPLSLPELKEGSLIAVGNSGAYGYATGMHFFLSHPLPAEVLLDGGEFYMIREPSVSEHLFRLQTRRKL